MKRAAKILAKIRTENEKLKDDFERIDTLDDVISKENMFKKKDEINQERAALIDCMEILTNFICETKL
jgi:hypothetical protein